MINSTLDHNPLKSRGYQVQKEIVKKDQRLDCVYDDETLGFEKDLVESTTKVQPQDPLEEIDLGDGSTRRLTYISANIDPNLRLEVIELLKEFKYFLLGIIMKC